MFKESSEGQTHFQNRSKYWDSMVDILDKNFPKKKCKERGAAMVMLSEIELLLRGKEVK